MKIQVPLLHKTLPISALPLTTAGASHLLRKFGLLLSPLVDAWGKDQNTEGRPQDSSENSAVKNIFSMIALVLEQFEAVTISIYDSYLVFLVIMMILHIGIYHRKDLITKKSAPVSSRPSAFLQHSVSLITCYTLSFLSLKLFLAIVLTASHAQTSVPQLQTSQQIILDETYPLNMTHHFSANRMLIEQKPKYLNSLLKIEISNLTPLDVIFSKDFHYAYEVDMNKSLVIYDISDPEDPSPISSIDGAISRDKLSPFGLLSPKGELLFIDGEYIQIVNVADAKHPIFVSQIQCREKENPKQHVFRRKPSLAISSDEKYLISSDPSLRIYDISDLEEAKLIFHDESWKATTVVLSADDRTAFIGSEGQLKILNLADFSAPEFVSSLPLDGEVLTFVLSEDQKTLYVIAYKDKEDVDEQALYVVDVTNVKNPTADKKIFKSYERIPTASLTLSPDHSFFVLQSIGRLWVMNLDDFNYVTIPRNPQSFQNLALLPNGKNAVIFSANFYQLAETYFNLPYPQADSLEPNIIAKLDFSPIPSQIIPDPFFQRAYILARKLGSDDKVLLDINLDDHSEPKLTETFDLGSSIASLFALSSDGDSIYYKSRSKVLQVLSTEKEGKLSKKRTIKFKHDFEPMFIVSFDEDTLFILSKNETDPEKCGYLSIYDISDSSPQLLSTLLLGYPSSSIAFQSPSIYMRLSPDEKTLFILDIALHIINVTDPEAPSHMQINAFPNSVAQTFVFTSDYKVCFVACSTILSSQKAIWVLNTTDVGNIKTLSKSEFPFDMNYWLSVTSNGELLMTTSNYLITLKVNGGKLEPYRYQSVNALAFTPLKNTSNLVICNRDGLQIINPRPKFAVYTITDKFKLGNIYSVPLKILQLNKYSNYATLSKNYKFIHASLIEGAFDPLEKLAFTFSMLPHWMSFDKENALLNLDLALPVEPAPYQIRSKASTQISLQDFEEIEGANYNESDAKALLVHLVAQGYLDSERYLTASFDEGVPLILSEQYSDFEDEIVKILKSHTLEMLSSISINSSLSLQKSKILQVVTDSKNPISVAIKLIPEQAKFVSQAFYGVKFLLEADNASLTLEGALADVNKALENLLINVEEDEQPCEASVAILDGLNPQATESIEDITDYFKINGQPQMQEEYSVQGQVDRSPVIIAGERFNIDFDKATFTDPNERPLDYSLEMVDPKADLPGWISLRGVSLSGTPPEAFLPYTKTFVIRASNKYRSQAIVFTLRIRLSWMTIASRAMVIIGYLFTVFKAWQHSDKVYNILCRKYYQYPTILKIAPGQEISKNMIFPIALITGEIQNLSKAILSEIKKDLGQGKAPFNDKQTIDYLTNDGDLNKERLVEIIEDIVKESHNKISEYHKQDGFNKKLIFQVILNDLTMKRIKLKNEKTTLKIFEKIKSKWIELVDFNQDSNELIINNENLISLLQDYKVDLATSNQSDTTTEYSLDERVNDDDDSESLSKKIPTKKSIEKELVFSSDSKINIGLIKDAILAHAFIHQNLWTIRNDINIQSRELSKNKSALLKFARLDTKSLVSSSTKRLGFGLKYEYVGNQIIFYGELQEQVKNKTIIIQVISKSGWILREFFIQISAGDMRRDERSLLEVVHAEL